MTNDGQRDDAGPDEVNPEAVVVEAEGAEETITVGAATDSALAAAGEAAGETAAEAAAEEESIQRAEESGRRVEAAADQEGEDQAASPQSMKAPHISTLYDKQVGQASLSDFCASA